MTPHEEMQLSAIEFIRRFMTHIPPDNFRRIRFYGLLAGKERNKKLAIANELLFVEHFLSQESVGLDEAETLPDRKLCPRCKSSRMVKYKDIRVKSPPFIVFRNEKQRRNHAA